MASAVWHASCSHVSMMEPVAPDPIVASWYRWLRTTIETAPPAIEGTLRSMIGDLGSPDPARTTPWFRFDGHIAPRLLAAVTEVLADLHVGTDAPLRSLLACAWDLVVADRLEEGHLLPGERLPIPAPVVAGHLTRRGLARLARLVAGDDPTWEALEARADARARALAAFADDVAPADPTDWRTQTIGRYATGAVLGAAAASLAGQPERALPIARALDSIHVAEDAVLAVTHLRAETRLGRPSPLARLCAAEAGIEPGPLHGPEAIAGLVALSATLRRALELGRAGLAEARPILAALPRCRARLEAADVALVERQARLGPGIELGAGGRSASWCRRPSDRDAALRRADEALAVDPLAREAWEVHRWGLFGMPLATASRFPRALLAGLAAERGRPDPATARSLILDWRACDYGYFEERGPLPPDIDSLGTLARLFAQVADDRACHEVFDAPLAWLETNLAAEGAAPVFLLRGWAAPEAERDRTFKGTSCLTCQLHLAEGLLELPHRQAAELLPRVVAGALVGLERGGMGEASYYRSSWTAMVLARLARRLHGSPELALAKAAECLAAQAERTVAHLLDSGPTLAIDLACLRLALGPAPSAVTTMLDGRLLGLQRADGLWEGDPIYSTPGSGSSGWLRSRLLTTAVVARALTDVPA